MHLRYSAFIVCGITAGFFVFGVFVRSGSVRVDEFWFALLLLFVPAAMTLGAIWVFLSQVWWRPLLGVVLLVPSIGLWVAMLLLAFMGFRIH